MTQKYCPNILAHEYSDVYFGVPLHFRNFKKHSFNCLFRKHEQRLIQQPAIATNADAAIASSAANATSPSLSSWWASVRHEPAVQPKSDSGPKHESVAADAKTALQHDEPAASYSATTDGSTKPPEPLALDDEDQQRTTHSVPANVGIE